jgi:antirestriction protein
MSDEVELPDEVDESERGAWDAWLANGNTDDSADDFRDAYAGEWMSLEDYAEQLFNDVYDIPAYIINYVNWELVARDLEYGDVWTANTRGGNSFYVFRNV